MQPKGAVRQYVYYTAAAPPRLCKVRLHLPALPEMVFGATRGKRLFAAGAEPDIELPMSRLPAPCPWSSAPRVVVLRDPESAIRRLPS